MRRNDENTRIVARWRGAIANAKNSCRACWRMVAVVAINHSAEEGVCRRTTHAYRSLFVCASIFFSFRLTIDGEMQLIPWLTARVHGARSPFCFLKYLSK